MPAPLAVELLPFTSEWRRRAEIECERLRAALGPTLAAVHHIGSTAVPGLAAKPIVDLLGEVRTLEDLDAATDRVERCGFRAWGEYGIVGRRYFTLESPITGRREVHLHCFQVGSPEIARHLAFRDYLRSHPDAARRYEDEKRRCRDLHPRDSHAYTDAKAAWIAAELRTAVEWHTAGGATQADANGAGYAGT